MALIVAVCLIRYYFENTLFKIAGQIFFEREFKSNAMTLSCTIVYWSHSTLYPYLCLFFGIIESSLY